MSFATAMKAVRNRVTNRERLLSVAACAPAAVLALLFWREDVRDPLTAPALLLDRMFQILTLVCAPMIIFALIAPARAARQAMVLISAVSTGLSIAVVVSGFLRSPTDYCVIAISMLGAVTGGIVLVRCVLTLDLLTTLPSRLGAGALALALPLVQFWNASAFLPATTVATLTPSVSISAVERVDDTFEVLVALDAINDSDARVIVIIGRLTICWWGAEEIPDFGDKAPRELDNCAVLEPLAEGAWVQSKNTLRYRNVIAIPVSAPRLTVRSRIAYARGDRLRTTDDVTEIAEGASGCAGISAIRLEEESRLKGIAQIDKFLVYADLNSDGGRNFFFTSDDIDECSRSGSDELQEYFGVTSIDETLDTWLVEPSPD